jgi:hypothetical protein
LDMKWFIRLASMAITLVASAAHSADIAMRRVLSCAGPDAKIEVYIPETAWAGAGVGNARLDTRVVGTRSISLPLERARPLSRSMCSIPRTRRL